MKRRMIAVGCILILAASFLGNADSGKEPAVNAAKIDIVCTTSQLGAVVDAVGGDLVETRTIIPFGMCPGHFDISPGEVKTVLEARLLIHHGYEHFLKSFDAEGTKNMVKVAVPGNWMIPSIHVRAAHETAAVLTSVDPGHAADFTRHADTYAAMVTSFSDSLTKAFSKLRGTPVVCSAMNRDFAEWLGFTVVAEFPRDEDISIKGMHDIITTGRGKKAKLVIDNRQSSGKVGTTIAKNIGIPCVVLTNFPDTGAPDKTASPYLASLADNCRSVGKALDNIVMGAR